MTAPATPLDVLARALDDNDDDDWSALVAVQALYEAAESLATYYADPDHSAAGLAVRLDALYEVWSDCDDWRPATAPDAGDGGTGGGSGEG